MDDKPTGATADGSTLPTPADRGALEAALPPAITRRPIGRTPIEPTILTLGTWGLADGAYGPADPEQLRAVIDAAIEQGIRSFDVAPLWGDGRAEELVGAAIRERRDDFTVVTRAGAIRKGHSVVRMFDPGALEGSLELSRRRLGIDTLDALLLHDPPEKIVGQGAFAKALAGLEARGIIRSWGITTASAEAARLAMGFGAKVVSVPHHLLAPDVLAAIVDDAEAFGAGVLVRSPLAHGLLTEAGLARASFAPDDHRSRRWSSAALAVRQKQALGFSAAWTQKAPSLMAFALRFALSSPQVASAIVGPRTPEQLRELVAAVHDVNRLDALSLERTSQIAAVLGV